MLQHYLSLSLSLSHTHTRASTLKFALPCAHSEYQGEDPVLASKMVAAEVAGIQSQNVSGCVKQ